MPDSKKISFVVAAGDVTTFEADVMALKFAQSLFGADRAVVGALGMDESDMAALLPTLGSHKLLPTRAKISAKKVLFLSVPSLYRFRYEEIRQFGSDVLQALAADAPTTKHLAMTIHGVGYGLDEAEALQSQLAGLLDALESNRYPSNLERITLVEKNEDRAQRLAAVLKDAIPGGVVALAPTLSFQARKVISRSPLVSNVGRESTSKPHIYVVTSLPDEMDDIYYLGIKAPAKDAGYLCEIANLAAPKTQDIKANELAEQKIEVEVHKLLVNFFDEEELRTLCFDLKVDYDSLRGEGKAGKARELVSYLGRRARLLGLLETVKEQRPQAPWPDILQSTPPDQMLLERVKPRIDTACTIVADITTANPNIFLLVGYALGKEIPTILITRDMANVPIDVRGQRCVVYSKIRELQEVLTKEFLEMSNA